MKYKFRYIAPAKEFPNKCAWYWYIDTEDTLLDMVEKISKGIAGEALIGVMARNIENKKRAKEGHSLIAGHYKTIQEGVLDYKLMLDAPEKRLTLLELSEHTADIFVAPKIKSFYEYGAIYLGSNMMGFIMDDGQIPIKEVISEEFVFPLDEQEIIYISKWPDGKHYYLSSTFNREFKEKFNSYNEAEKYAIKFVDKKFIKSKQTPYVYTHIGD